MRAGSNPSGEPPCSRMAGSERAGRTSTAHAAGNSILNGYRPSGSEQETATGPAAYEPRSLTSTDQDSRTFRPGETEHSQRASRSAEPGISEESKIRQERAGNRDPFDTIRESSSRSCRLMRSRAEMRETEKDRRSERLQTNESASEARYNSAAKRRIFPGKKRNTARSRKFRKETNERIIRPGKRAPEWFPQFPPRGPQPCSRAQDIRWKAECA